MGGRVYFMTDGALETKRLILDGEMPEHILYGGLELEKDGKAIIEDYTLKNILKKRRGDIVVTNRLKFIPLMKILGIKTILVNMNSNHDLEKRKNFSGYLRYKMYKEYYSLCDIIICLSKTQVKNLKKIAAKKIIVMPLGVNNCLIKTIKLDKKYLLSCGLDGGRNFNFIRDSLGNLNLKILDYSNRLPYKEYLKVLGGASAVVLDIDSNKKIPLTLAAPLLAMKRC